MKRSNFAETISREKTAVTKNISRGNFSTFVRNFIVNQNFLILLTCEFLNKTSLGKIETVSAINLPYILPVKLDETLKFCLDISQRKNGSDKKPI
ncbi:MAG: hypothetical protein WBA93_30915 [Microcoleaceae cyanobacterium]